MTIPRNNLLHFFSFYSFLSWLFYSLLDVSFWLIHFPFFCVLAFCYDSRHVVLLLLRNVVCNATTKITLYLKKKWNLFPLGVCPLHLIKCTDFGLCNTPPVSHRWRDREVKPRSSCLLVVVGLAALGSFEGNCRPDRPEQKCLCRVGFTGRGSSTSCRWTLVAYSSLSATCHLR